MINIAAPYLIGREKEYVLDCLDRGMLSSVGEYVERFEDAFAAFCGTNYAVACSSGTAALHLAMLALDLSPGELVIVPSLTYVATANAVSYCGAKPVFCDVEPQTWNIDPIEVEMKLRANKRVVGMIPVHLYGVPAAMTALSELAERYGLWIVEDAAEAHGARHQQKFAGSIGEMGTFSFYGNKLLTCGEGGIVTTNDKVLRDRLRLYRGQGVDPAHRYYHKVIGYNYRMTNIQAAIALAQVESFEEHASRRDILFAAYESLLQGFEIQRHDSNDVSANWMFTVLVPRDVNRDRVMAQMAESGVETRPMFVPLNELPIYTYGALTPIAAEISRRGISLPTHAHVTYSQAVDISKLFRSAVEKNRAA